MLESMRTMPNDYDIISFFKDVELSEKNDDEVIDINFRTYNEPGEKHESGGLGDTWHIVICYNVNDDEDKIKPVDMFEAILLDPREYASNLIKQGFCGMLARKTSNSSDFVDGFVRKVEVARQEVLKYTG